MKGKLKRAAAWLLVLAVLGGAGFGAYTWYRHATKLEWPEFPANKDGQPQSILKLAGNRDFGYYCGEIIPATLYVRCPEGWEPQGDVTVKGDLEAVEVTSVREMRDGVLYVRFNLPLQTVDPKNFRWETNPSLTFKHGGKLETVDFPPIRVSGSPTFDGNKDAPLKHPETVLLFGQHGLVTIGLLAAGGLGVIVFPVLLLRSFRRKEKPKVEKQKPLPPPDPKARVQAAFLAVLGGDWVSEDGMKELALAVREFFKIPERMFPEQLLFSGSGIEQAVGHVLDIVEGAYIWKTREFVPERDLEELRGIAARLLDLPPGTFAEKEPVVDPWQDKRGEASQPEVKCEAAAAEPQLTADELDRIAMEVLMAEETTAGG